MISDRDVQFYRDNGYLVVENVFSADEVTALRADTEAMVAKAAEVTANNDIYDLEDSHSPAEPRVRRIKTPHKFMSSANSLARHPRLVSILTRLIGPGVRLDTSKLNMKSAGFGAAVEWHQDWAFYPHTNDDLLAVGVMMDDMNLENGPLQIIPGSHKGPRPSQRRLFLRGDGPGNLRCGFLQSGCPNRPGWLGHLSSRARYTWFGAQYLEPAASLIAVSVHRCGCLAPGAESR